LKFTLKIHRDGICVFDFGQDEVSSVVVSNIPKKYTDKLSRAIDIEPYRILVCQKYHHWSYIIGNGDIINKNNSDAAFTFMRDVNVLGDNSKP